MGSALSSNVEDGIGVSRMEEVGRTVKGHYIVFDKRWWGKVASKQTTKWCSEKQW